MSCSSEKKYPKFIFCLLHVYSVHDWEHEHHLRETLTCLQRNGFDRINAIYQHSPL